VIIGGRAEPGSELTSLVQAPAVVDVAVPLESFEQLIGLGFRIFQHGSLPDEIITLTSEGECVQVAENVGLLHDRPAGSEWSE
jgi:hypothetical protein